MIFGQAASLACSLLKVYRQLAVSWDYRTCWEQRDLNNNGQYLRQGVSVSDNTKDTTVSLPLVLSPLCAG